MFQIAGRSEKVREVVQLVRQAVGAGRRAYVLVNNRAEGNAPLTVQALAEMMYAAKDRWATDSPQRIQIYLPVASPRSFRSNSRVRCSQGCYMLAVPISVVWQPLGPLSWDSPRLG